MARAQQVAELLTQLAGSTPDEYAIALVGFDAKDICGGLAAWAGGVSTLMELTDVTGDTGINKSPVDDGSGIFPLTEITTKTDLDAILASVAAVNWNYLEPLNGFENLPSLFGDNWAPLRYRLTLNNIVHLEGLVKPPPTQSGSPVVIAMLPEECHTGYDLVFPAKSAIPNEEGHVYYRSDGRLELASAQPWPWVSLCGISWSVEADT